MSSSDVNHESYLIPLEEIQRVTENFSPQRYIGRGGFGKVYRGQLSEQWGNRIVAIKRLDPDSYQGEHEFRNELKIISSFHHENIISFVGYCDQGNEMIIVYEYASKGSLDQHLQDQNKMSCITWIQRLQICIGAARGLNYLHSGHEKNISVIHRDVKSANILLDENLIPKVCDFGLSKSGSKNQSNSQFFTKVAGTQFYVDPGYHESHILRKESDVYSFGVVLFEILSGVLVHCESMIGGERHILMNSVRRYHRKEPQMLIDPNIRDHIDMGSFETFKEIAYQCIRLDSYERPMLDTVIKKLEEALIIQIHWSSSVIRGSAVGAQSFNTILTILPMLKESFKKCFKKCCSQLVEEERGTWSDLLIQVLCDEWTKCKREIEASSSVEEPKSILFPPTKSSSSDMIPDESSFVAADTMYERVKVFVLLHQLQFLSAGKSLPDEPLILPPAELPKKSRAKSAGLNVIGPILGTELNLVDGVGCKISFERGKQRQFSFLAISMGTSGWIILAEELPQKPQYGTVRVIAPLVGCKPKIDERHSRWLHLRIRLSTLPLTETTKNAADLKLESKPLTDGSWTLAFRDEASCKSALAMILEEIDLQCNEVERRLTPLIASEQI